MKQRITQWIINRIRKEILQRLAITIAKVILNKSGTVSSTTKGRLLFGNSARTVWTLVRCTSTANRESSAAPKKQTKRLSWQGWKWLRNVAQRQLSNKATTDCYVPCAGAFRSFGRQKNITETKTMIIATNIKGKKNKEYKKICVFTLDFTIELSCK